MVYKGWGARLEWALLNYFIDSHLADGYEFILPPLMLEYECGLTAGQFPKFADEVYKIENPTDDRTHYMQQGLSFCLLFGELSGKISSPASPSGEVPSADGGKGGFRPSFSV